jgi:esterase/lipase
MFSLGVRTTNVKNSFSLPKNCRKIVVRRLLKMLNFRTLKYNVMEMFFRTLLVILIVVFIVYLVGPEAPRPQLNTDLPTLSGDLDALEMNILQKERSGNIKPDNEARFIWAGDSLKERTEWALLYLHGFSASWFEGSPVNVEFARHYGCNAYFARLAAHGVDTTETLLDMTPDALWESAKEALMVARKIGKRVVIMASSTGGTLALKLAAEFPEYVDGLILYSPNVRMNNPAAFLLSKPWGLYIARAAYGGKYRVTNEDYTSTDCKYWNCKYRLEALVNLQLLIEKTMKKEVFERVTCPVFLGYYFKDDENQDQVVRVDAALKMFEQLGTPTELKNKQAFPEAGNHVIASGLFSNSVEELQSATFRFAGDILKINNRVF